MSVLDETGREYALLGQARLLPQTSGFPRADVGVGGRHSAQLQVLLSPGNKTKSLPGTLF